MDRKKVEDSLVLLLKYIGEDPTRSGLLDTPKRMLRSFDEIFSGYRTEISSIFTTFDLPSNEVGMIVLRDCEFFSTCEHHFLPFHGKCHIGYIPGNRLLGLSKLARIVEVYSRRLQIQERLTKQIVDCLEEHIKPKGVICVMEAVHLCMRSRGVRIQGSSVTTAEVTGVFADASASAKSEFMQYIKK